VRSFFFWTVLYIYSKQLQDLQRSDPLASSSRDRLPHLASTLSVPARAAFRLPSARLHGGEHASAPHLLCWACSSPLGISDPSLPRCAGSPDGRKAAKRPNEALIHRLVPAVTAWRDQPRRRVIASTLFAVARPLLSAPPLIYPPPHGSTMPHHAVRRTTRGTTAASAPVPRRSPRARRTRPLPRARWNLSSRPRL
jgi:hypothetical protein